MNNSIRRSITRPTTTVGITLLFALAASGVTALLPNPTAEAAKSQQAKNVSSISPIPDGTTRAQITEAFGRLPMRFEANKGQSDEKVKFLSRGNGYTLF